MTAKPVDTIRKPLLFALSLAFTARVKQGDRVRLGDVLAEVDLAYIKAQGKPLVSPIVFTDGEAITVRQKNVDVTRGEGGIIDL